MLLVHPPHMCTELQGFLVVAVADTGLHHLGGREGGREGGEGGRGGGREGGEGGRGGGREGGGGGGGRDGLIPRSHVHVSSNIQYVLRPSHFGGGVAWE